RRHPRSPLFPYTTLFRSRIHGWRQGRGSRPARGALRQSARRTDSSVPEPSAADVIGGLLAVDCRVEKKGWTAVHPERRGRRKDRSEEHTSELQSRENLVC